MNSSISNKTVNDVAVDSLSSQTTFKYNPCKFLAAHSEGFSKRQPISVLIHVAIKPRPAGWWIGFVAEVINTGLGIPLDVICLERFNGGC